MSLFDGVEIFVRVVEAGSFTAAGKDLGLAKSSVSEAVRRLEDHLNVRLLDRTTRRLALTEAGQAFYDHARRAINQAKTARAAARSLGLEPRGAPAGRRAGGFRAPDPAGPARDVRRFSGSRIRVHRRF